MSNFEKKIAEIEFDQVLPPEGHRNRFEQKLNEHFSKKRTIKWHIAAYAASIVLLISVSLMFFLNQEVDNSAFLLSIENEEFVESELYYQQQIAIKMAAIQQLNEDDTSYTLDLVEFDESLESLKSDLNEAPGDVRVVEAVLNTYMLKIEALDNIVTILKKIS